MKYLIKPNQAFFWSLFLYLFIGLNLISCTNNEDINQEGRSFELQKTLKQLADFQVSIGEGKNLKFASPEDKELVIGNMNLASQALMRFNLKGADDVSAQALLSTSLYALKAFDVHESDYSQMTDLKLALAQFLNQSLDTSPQILFSWDFSEGFHSTGSDEPPIVAYQFSSFSEKSDYGVWNNPWTLDTPKAQIRGYGEKDWLISPKLDLTKVEEPQFRIYQQTQVGHNSKKTNQFINHLITKHLFQLKLSYNYENGSPTAEGVEWINIEIPVEDFPAGKNFVKKMTSWISLADYKEEPFTLAFFFNSQDSKDKGIIFGKNYLEWNILNFQIMGSGAMAFVPRQLLEGVKAQFFFNTPDSMFQSLFTHGQSGSWKRKGATWVASSTVGVKSDAWLFSPALFPEGEVSNLKFRIKGKGFNGSYLKFLLSSDYEGNDPARTEWVGLEYELQDNIIEGVIPDSLIKDGYVLAFQFTGNQSQQVELQSLEILGEGYNFSTESFVLSYVSPDFIDPDAQSIFHELSFDGKSQVESVLKPETSAPFVATDTGLFIQAEKATEARIASYGESLLILKPQNIPTDKTNSISIRFSYTLGKYNNRAVSKESIKLVVSKDDGLTFEDFGFDQKLLKRDSKEETYPWLSLSLEGLDLDKLVFGLRYYSLQNVLPPLTIHSFEFKAD